MLICYEQFYSQAFCRNAGLASLIIKQHFSVEHKLTLVVRKDLPMKKGKVAAQCAHAAVRAFKNSTTVSKNMWSLQGEPKIVVGCNNEEELLSLYQKAQTSGVLATLIKDAGRTQLTPGTSTVLAIGPGPSDKVNLITGHLKLL